MDKIICVGKNYLEHAQELGDAVPEKPVLFLKPPSVLVQVKSEGGMPRDRGSVHHECEVVLRLTVEGRFDAVTLGLDMTLRDLQSELKKKGHPWEMGKVFKGSALLGPWIELDAFAGLLETDFSFSLDGQTRQRGRACDMRMAPQQCIDYAREYFPICAGDALFTGTPAGVGPVRVGQKGELRWGDRALFSVQWM